MGESNYLDYCRSIRLDLLDLFGSEYVIDHVVCEHKKYTEETTYKCYISDVTKAIAEYFGVEVNMRFMDIITNSKKEEKTADEIVIDIINRAGLKVK